ncbi:PAS domain-containing sensor histidine kinase [Bacteroidota bacterium]
MIFKRFNTNILIRFGIFAICSLLLGVSLVTQKILWTIPLAIISIVSGFALIYYFNRTNNKLSLFIEAIKNEDSTLHFPENVGGKYIKDYHASLNKLNSIISEIKISNQHNEMFFREMLKYSSTGIIAVDDKDFVDLINDSALQLLGLKSMGHLKSLVQKQPELYKALKQLESNQNQTFKFLVGKELRQVSLKMIKLNFGAKAFKIYSFYDIKMELEEKELDTWQKLIRVLTHEIMNSIAPITSLSKTLSRFFKERSTDMTNSEDLEVYRDKAIEGLNVIEETGNGLMRFVENYRKLAKVPTPIFNTIIIEEWIKSVKYLIQPLLDDSNSVLTIKKDTKKSSFITDQNLLTQVIINMINNAIEAIGSNEKGKIDLLIKDNSLGNLCISIIDNGRGISAEEIDKIFIPFFTTKDEGSGIGLSLSRQIMRVLKGNISVNSTPGKQTIFTLNL